MFENIIRFSIEQRWLVMLAVLGMAGLGVYSYQAAHRRRGRHHQRAGRHQHAGARLLAAGDRAARHLPDRDRHGRPARPGADPLAVALRPVAGHRHLQGRHRHLLRAPAGQPAHPGGARPPAARRHAGHGADLHRPGRNLPLDGGSRARRAASPTAPPYTPTDLREIQDWVIKPQLRNVPGVTEINSIGGFEKQYVVAPNLERLSPTA